MYDTMRVTAHDTIIIQPRIEKTCGHQSDFAPFTVHSQKWEEQTDPHKRESAYGLFIHFTSKKNWTFKIMS